MWRVLNQYMDTMNGPPSFLEVPRSPITGTVFHQAASTKMIHIAEFTADLIRNKKLKLDRKRNKSVVATFHDSCNPARSMGLFEEPRTILRAVCKNFHEMPENTIREQTFCCGGGAGLGTDENMEMRLRGGMPRGNAVRYVADKHAANRLVAMCAIDRATLETVCKFWAPSVKVSGLHELVANAMVLKGEHKRELNLRKKPLYSEGTPEEDESDV
jgi:Fe-S oxidoreductase